MTIRTALGVCAVVLGSLAVSTGASASDPYDGFGPSDAGAQPISPDPVIGGSTSAVDQTLPWLQQQSQNQPETYGDGLQQGAVDDGSDVDDASGH